MQYNILKTSYLHLKMTMSLLSLLSLLMKIHSTQKLCFSRVFEEVRQLKNFQQLKKYIIQKDTKNISLNKTIYLDDIQRNHIRPFYVCFLFQEVRFLEVV